MQAAGVQHASLAAAVRALLAERGAAGLWLGWAPTAQRAAVVAAAELGGYESAKEALVARAGSASAGGHLGVHLAASLAAGALASAASSPLDVLKSRVMLQGGSAWGAAAGLIRQEGVRGLFRGVPADFARRGPHTAVSFAVLEQLRGAWGGAGGGGSR